MNIFHRNSELTEAEYKARIRTWNALSPEDRAASQCAVCGKRERQNGPSCQKCYEARREARKRRAIARGRDPQGNQPVDDGTLGNLAAPPISDAQLIRRRQAYMRLNRAQRRQAPCIACGRPRDATFDGPSCPGCRHW